MSEARHFSHILATAPTADRLILLITFLLTVFVDLVIAVNVGVILAMLHFLRRMSESVETHTQDAQSLQAELESHGLPPLPSQVLVYEITGPMFFGAVENFERALAQTHSQPATLIIRLRHVPFMDITGIETLKEVTTKLSQQGVNVILCEANERVLAKLKTAQALSADGTPGYLRHFPEAVRLGLAISPHSPPGAPGDRPKNKH